ncbi:MAG: YfhO family protein [Bacteroidia bacterium]
MKEVNKNKATKESPKAKSAEVDFYTAKIQGKESYILLGALVLGCYLVFQDFITLKKVYLFKDIGSDSINIYFPWLVQLTDYIKQNGAPSWSFSQGLGQNVFPLWLGDFFSNFLMFFDKEKLPYGLAFMEVIKILLCGIIFFNYLKELKVSRFSAYIGAFLFSFCGYIMVGGCWAIFSSEAVYAALTLYGFERWLNHKKWLWFVIGLVCISFLQPFFLFMYAILLAIYAPIRYNDLHEGDWKKFPLFIIKTASFATLAVALTAYQLFPDLLQYIESPRVGGEASFIAKLKAQPLFTFSDEVLRFTTTFRAFGSDMLGTGSNFKGWQNYLEAPLFYCGIFCLVTFPQVFSSFTKKQKVAYGILTALFVLPILFPYFRNAFWAFTGDYFRTFSLFITLLLLTFSVKALHHIIKTERLNKVVLGVTVLFLLMLLYTPAAQFKLAINQGYRTLVTALIFTYAGLLIGLTSKNSASTSKIVLMVVCFFEMIYTANTTVNKRSVITAQELTNKVGYNDYSVDAIKLLKDTDKSFYRINKDFGSGLAIHRSINDAKVQGYYGTTSYYSFNQKNYIKFLGDFNVINPKDENATRWASGIENRPLLFSLLSGKYWLSKRPDNYLKGFGYDSIAQFGDVKVLRNRYSLPLGFATDMVLDDSSFKKLSPTQKDLVALRGLVVANEDNDLLSFTKKFNLADTAIPFSFDKYEQYVKELKKDSLTITQFKESDIKGDITVSAPKILFFSIPFDEGWKATVNNTDAKLYRVNAGLTGLIIPIGKSAVELKFEPRYMIKGMLVSILALLVFAGLLVIETFKHKKTASTLE